jgi:hypothetical protein
MLRAALGNRLTTVFLCQGRYALDPLNVTAYPTAYLTVERIGELVNYDLPVRLGTIEGGYVEQEEL